MNNEWHAYKLVPENSSFVCLITVVYIYIRAYFCIYVNSCTWDGENVDGFLKKII